LLIALGAAGVTIVFIAALPDVSATITLAVICVVAYAAYPGTALRGQQPKVIPVETVVLVAGVALVLLGVTSNPVWLAVALGLHGFVDLAHEHPRDRLVEGVPGWYTRFCLTYDWLVAPAALFVL
jgi:hypothetical protein